MERLQRIFTEGLSVFQGTDLCIYIERDIAYQLANNLDMILENNVLVFSLSNRKKTFVVNISFRSESGIYIRKQAEGKFDAKFDENNLQLMRSWIHKDQMGYFPFELDQSCTSNCGIDYFHFSISDKNSVFRFAR